MSITIKTERQDSCGICEKLCIVKTMFVNDGILELLKYLVEDIDTSTLQNSLICEECLDKINEAYQFKTVLVEALKREKKMEIKQEPDCDTKFIMCFCCKNTITVNTSLSLLDATNLDVSNYLFKKEDIEKVDNPQICNNCQVSILNLQAIITLLSVYDKSKLKHEQLDSEYPLKRDIDEEFMNQDIKSEVNMIEFKEEIKEEKMDSENENNILSQDLQMKTEEFFMKCEYNEEDSTGEVVLDHQKDTYKRSSLNKNNLNSNGKHKGHPKRDSFIHQNKNEVKMLKCDICDYQTKTNAHLQQHSIIHKSIDEIVMFKCDICEYETRHHRSLKRHSVIHKSINEIEMFRCDVCDYQTKSKAHLQQHSIIHKSLNEIVMFKCDICEYETKFKHNLKQHSVIHKSTNEIMFKCDICEYETKSKHYLKRHSVIHKNVNEIVMFKCDICEHETRHKRGLKRHSIIHKNVNEIMMFKCDICEYETKYKGGLKRHSAVHKSMNGIMFKCDICEFETKSKDYLKRHSVTHKNVNEIVMLKCDI